MAGMHTVEGMILWVVTTGLAIYFIVFLLALWADRPMIGRDDNGTVRVARGKAVD